MGWRIRLVMRLSHWFSRREGIRGAWDLLVSPEDASREAHVLQGQEHLRRTCGATDLPLGVTGDQ